MTDHVPHGDLSTLEDLDVQSRQASSSKQNLLNYRYTSTDTCRAHLISAKEDDSLGAWTERKITPCDTVVIGTKLNTMGPWKVEPSLKKKYVCNAL